MGEAAETYLFQGVTRSGGFPLASQCLWGKLQKYSPRFGGVAAHTAGSLGS